MFNIEKNLKKNNGLVLKKMSYKNILINRYLFLFIKFELLLFHTRTTLALTSLQVQTQCSG